MSDNKPVKDDVFTLEITETNNLGCGVAHVPDGRVVFVYGAVGGDMVEIKIIKDNKSYLVARTERVISPSPIRATGIFCTAPQSCGGCVYRNISYEAELGIKREYVATAFRKAGLPDIEVLPLQSAGEEYSCGYRNKAQFPLTVIKGRTVAGFYAQKTHTVIPATSCSLTPPLFSEIVTFVCGFIDREGITVYNEKTHTGLVRHIYIREGVNANAREIMLCLVINANGLPKYISEKLYNEIVKEFPTVRSLYLNINTEITNRVLGDNFIHIGGEKYITDTLCGLKFRILPGAFYQVNHRGAEILYTLALKRAFGDIDSSLAVENSEPCATVLDLYCGTGTIGLCAAKYASKVIGIEIEPSSVECATANASDNGITDARFFVGDACDAERILTENGIANVDMVFTDPPRKGLTPELISYISNKLSPEKIVYVSCDPDTLARDLRLFADLGYHTNKAEPVDMFPRTGHVETVVLMSRI